MQADMVYFITSVVVGRFLCAATDVDHVHRLHHTLRDGVVFISIMSLVRACVDAFTYTRFSPALPVISSISLC